MQQRKYGDGKSIIEILNIGFEPLLTNEEYKIFQEMGELKKELYKIKRILNRFEYFDNLILDKTMNDYKKYYKNKKEIIDKYIKLKKEKFKILLNKNIKKIRNINDNRKFFSEEQFRKIAIFESDLTRAFECNDMEYSDDIISVVTYYTEIFNSIIHNGFIYKNKKFVFFTAGAGQTRNKKSTFVSEDKLNENFNKLFCGLTKEEINKLGGMNTNKYLAYTSLCQTNSSIWEDFNIDRAIVVDDIEFEIPNQKVRYIYTETPQDKEELLKLRNRLNEIKDKLKIIEEKTEQENLIKERKNINKLIKDLKSKYHTTQIKEMNVKIPFTDGFGIMFKENNNCMVRAPFIKGLFSYISKNKFQKFSSKNKIKINKIVDIYGKEHSINDIDYIFTKSQFKMNGYYKNIIDNNGKIIKTGWEIYKENFKKYKCNMCRCNIENNTKLNAKTNYQILQTLTTEMTDEEIKYLALYDINNLNGIGNDLQSMLNILGANEEKNNNLNNFQKSLILYPEMLKDFYVKKLLKNTKDSMIKKMRSGKFNINGSYIFVIPELLACLQWWFHGERDLNKLGLLKENEIYCRLFKDKEELDCVRSPHLDHSHCIRNNKNTEEMKYWYNTNGIYVGVKDIMSKLLMYDNDGDALLVHNNIIIIGCSKSFQKKYGMIPNYYEMPKANSKLLNNDSLFEGIVTAYHHGNIGSPSNEITKIFDTLDINSTEEEIKEAIELVALRTCDVNYTIDFAKTLYKPEISSNVLKKYKEYSGRKVPHFFIYAKDKKENQVEKITNNNINRITEIVKSNKIVFKDFLGKYSYKNLINKYYEDYNISQNIINSIVELYKDIDNKNQRKLGYIDINSLDCDEREKFNIQIEYDSLKQRNMFVDFIKEDINIIVNVLVKELKNEPNKDTLWKLFGDIIYENISNNLKNTKICECCKERFEIDGKGVGKPKLLCDECARNNFLKKHETYNKKR